MFFLNRLIYFLGNIKFIRKLFDTKINKIIRITVTRKNEGQTLKYQDINILTKPWLYDIGIKLSKLVNAPLKMVFWKQRLWNYCFLYNFKRLKMISYCFFQLQKWIWSEDVGDWYDQQIYVILGMNQKLQKSKISLTYIFNN